MTIEKAISSDHQILTDITKKSKAYWGYSDEQIEKWSQFLTVTPVYIDANGVYKLIIEKKLAGYYSFLYEDEKTVKLDNLFILPEYIGKGFGKILMRHFLLEVEKTSVNKIILDSEPNAELFYTKLGFVKTGQIETSIKDRFMPIMELNIKSE
ncbi:GNAT family N-acetyltransferase [Flavobacterium sp. LC2016-12]|uniref:GNAT family N-acetyltransferase n=1 Tax=Flavobacterium sp. LC2016-12 TaxID=2783794 RepID=UPI001889EF31|nr:GNAT family N-acetyltransferase [Flavobacterium sp. LC2016-12]MBF4464485.1 GNAT family N-acetyltransferase [Flavobacterium sp. LC2016-12]